MAACIFWTIGRKRNKLVVDNVDISINRMKSTFFFVIFGLRQNCILLIGPNLW